MEEFFQQMFFPTSEKYLQNALLFHFYDICVDTEFIIDGAFVICLFRYGIKRVPCFPLIYYFGVFK